MHVGRAAQYGYLALFAPAYHLAPLLAFVKNIYTMREEAVRYCTQLRRTQTQTSGLNLF